MNLKHATICLFLIGIIHSLLSGFTFMDMGALTFYEATSKGYFALPNRFASLFIQLPFILAYKVSSSFTFLKWTFALSYSLLPLAMGYYLKKTKAPLLAWTALIFVTSHTVPTSQRITTAILFLFLVLTSQKNLKVVMQFISPFLHPFSLFYLTQDTFEEMKNQRRRGELLRLSFVILLSILIHFFWDSSYNQTSVGIKHLTQYSLQLPFTVFYGLLLILPRKRFSQSFSFFLVILSLNFLMSLGEGAQTIGELSYILKYNTLLSTLIFIRALRLKIEVSRKALFFFSFFISLISLSLTTSQSLNTRRLAHFIKVHEKDCVPLDELKEEFNIDSLFEDPYSVIYFYTYLIPSQAKKVIEFKGANLKCSDYNPHHSYPFNSLYPFEPPLPDNFYFRYPPSTTVSL